MTKENDIVLIRIENKPASFARIEEITSDAKPEWFQVKLMLLQVPVTVATWILKENYINGEKFTMGGQSMHLEKVIYPSSSEKAGKKIKKLNHSNIIPLFDK